MSENLYDKFIRGGLHAGFNDLQVDFLADWFDIPDGTEKPKDMTNIKEIATQLNQQIHNILDQEMGIKPDYILPILITTLTTLKATHQQEVEEAYNLGKQHRGEFNKPDNK